MDAAAEEAAGERMKLIDQMKEAARVLRAAGLKEPDADGRVAVVTRDNYLAILGGDLSPDVIGRVPAHPLTDDSPPPIPGTARATSVVAVKSERSAVRRERTRSKPADVSTMLHELDRDGVHRRELPPPDDPKHRSRLAAVHRLAWAAGLKGKVRVRDKGDHAEVTYK